MAPQPESYLSELMSHIRSEGLIRPAQIKHVNMDTTVQTKAIRYPADARLNVRARERLVMTNHHLVILPKTGVFRTDELCSGNGFLYTCSQIGYRFFILPMLPPRRKIN